MNDARPVFTRFDQANLSSGGGASGSCRQEFDHHMPATDPPRPRGQDGFEAVGKDVLPGQFRERRHRLNEWLETASKTTS